MAYLHDFNPRTSYEMRLLVHKEIKQAYRISIHAPRMRCDDMIAWTWNSSEKFQSTHLV